MSNERTTDGRPLSVGITGFSVISTERPEAPTQPAPVLTPSDIINQIAKLEKFLTLPQIEQALKLLFIHTNDFKNPHHTTLDQFTQVVADVLYKEYIAQGGKGSKAFYLENLFQTLYVADLEDMDAGANPRALVSIRNAVAFIARHEKDPDAHKPLFDKLLPGEPIVEDPVFALYAHIGVSPYLLENTTSSKEDVVYGPYTFVGPDGYIHSCQLGELPIDYVNGEPLLPCFETRTNLILDSATFPAIKLSNLTVLKEAEESPIKDFTAQAFFAGKEFTVTEHNVLYPKVFLEHNTPMAFSVFAKAEFCRYFAISFKDMTSSSVEARGVYDLQNGTCISINHMNRYRASIQKLSNGWYRCCFSMFHEIGQLSDIKMTFFDEKDNDLMFQGNGELCGYLWGMQLEYGENTSPYIVTKEKPTTRNAIAIKVPLEDSWWTPNHLTLNTGWLNPGTAHLSSTRTVCSVVNEDGSLAMNAYYNKDGSFDIKRYLGIVSKNAHYAASVYQDHFDPTTIKFCQLSHGVGDEHIITLYNDTSVLKTDTPDEWDAGSYLYLGTDAQGNYLNGYIRHLLMYPIQVTELQAIFLNGEEIHG